MGTASSITSILLRLTTFCCIIVVIGIDARFISQVRSAGVAPNGRLVYTIVLACVSAVYAAVFSAPTQYNWFMWPADFLWFVAWMIAFGIIEGLTGTGSCWSSWYWSYWGFYWGGWWRRPIVVTGPSDIAWAGCASWRTMVAFTFIISILFFFSGCLGAYVSAKLHKEKRKVRNGAQVGTVPPMTSTGAAV